MSPNTTGGGIVVYSLIHVCMYLMNQVSSQRDGPGERTRGGMRHLLHKGHPIGNTNLSVQHGEEAVGLEKHGEVDVAGTRR